MVKKFVPGRRLNLHVDIHDHLWTEITRRALYLSVINPAALFMDQLQPSAHQGLVEPDRVDSLSVLVLHIVRYGDFEKLTTGIPFIIDAVLE